MPAMSALASFPALAFQLVAAVVVGVLVNTIPLGPQLSPGHEWHGDDWHVTIGNFSSTNRTSSGYNANRADGGHWEFRQNVSPPYNFSQQVCEASYLHEGDCTKTKTCPSDLMNWIYIGNDNKPYPKFDVEGFRRNMRNSRIIFIGPSMMRQQVQALAWTLGYERLDWNTTRPPKDVGTNCTAARSCFVDEKSNVTICHQFMGSMATKIYHRGNYTLDHSLRGHGDSSCLLSDEMIAEFHDFDLVFVQSVSWWTNLKNLLDSPTSPREWVSKMVPKMYYDAMNSLLSKISERSKTVFVLGQIGVDCQNKTAPEPFKSIPDKYGWNLAPKLWDTALTLIEEEGLDVQVVDARDPLMQSVHAHPSPDCLHFCMNSAAVNIYHDMYWHEVFSRHTI